MAEFAISSVVRYLGNLLYQEAIFLHGVNDQVEWIERELRRTQCFLKDADAKAQSDERVKNWVKDMRDVAYEAEDIIDAFLLKVKHWRQRGFVDRVKRYALMPLEFKARHQIHAEIEKIKVRINEISTSRAAYGIGDLGEGGGLPFKRPLPPHSDDADVVALADDKRVVVDRLLDGQNLRRCVLSIVGIGGLGKTTLARKIFSSNEVVRHFSVRVWLTVSHDFDLIRLLRKVLAGAVNVKKEELATIEEDDLIEAIKDSIKEKRYLVVMDDVWSRDVWDRIQSALPDTKNGSRVLITSRSLNVARLADPTVSPYELRCLNEEESLELLLKKAFPYQEMKPSCPEELLDVGRRLAHRCSGLPLALVVLGGLLSIKENTHSAWLKVAETMSWQAEGVGCMEILALSYKDLPYHLKPCFLYFAAFPEDYDISARRLFKLWVAEGFIPREERKSMEETAEAFLEELKQRCMVQITGNWNEKASKCRMHDLLHDLARSEARENGFLIVHKNKDESISSSRIARRAALQGDVVDLGERWSSTNFRALMLFGSSYQSLRSMPSMKLLRVIDVQGTFSYSNDGSKVERLPKEILNLIHLRYLRLRGIGLRKLPSSISDLQNLESIDVRDNHLREIPKTIWNIKALRHVHISRQMGLRISGFTFPATADLKDLQTLDRVWLGSDEIQWRLPNLRKLGLAGVQDDHGAALANIFDKLHHLTSLQLLCETSIIPEEIADTKAFPFHNRLQSIWLKGRWAMGDVYEFPPYLTELRLRSTRLKQDPMPKLEKLQYLFCLELHVDAYEGEEMICSAGGFPRLKYLKVSYLKDLEEWRLENGAMPKLAFLVIEKCHKLRMLPNLQRATRLEKLDLIDMSEEQEAEWLAGEDWHKIQHVPSIRRSQGYYIPKFRRSQVWGENSRTWCPKMVDIQR